MNRRDDDIDGAALAVRVESSPASVEPRLLFDQLSPRAKIALASEYARELKTMIDARNAAGAKLTVPIQGKDHLSIEAWQTLGMLVGVSCKVEYARASENGYEARAVVIRMDTGIEIGAGEGLCTRDEKRWSNAEDYAIKSMAQTRAQSRALAGVLRWIAVLGGYNPTPAEEMGAPPAARTTVRGSSRPATTQADDDLPITDKAVQWVAIESNKLGFTSDERHEMIRELTSGAKSSAKQLTRGEARALVAAMRAKAASRAA